MAKKENQKEETIVDVQGMYTRTEMFVDKHRKQLAIGLGAIAVAFGGFFAYQYLYQHPREEKAANAIYTAELWAEMDSLEWAVKGHDDSEGFESIASTYSGTKVAKRANYWCGVYYRDNGDFNTAINYFKEADFSDDVMGPIILANIGDMYVQQGNNEEGASYLEKAARKAAGSDSKNFLGPIYFIKAAKVFMEMGKDDKAIALLQQATEDYDNRTQEYQEATKLLAMLKSRNS